MNINYSSCVVYFDTKLQSISLRDHGVELKPHEAYEVSRIYTVACTAEFILEKVTANGSTKINDDLILDVFQIAEAVRDIMDEVPEYTEVEAIEAVKDKFPASLVSYFDVVETEGYVEAMITTAGNGPRKVRVYDDMPNAAFFLTPEEALIW